MPKINKVCNICNKDFTTFNKNAMFCSRECYNKFKQDMILKMVCEVCGNEFKTCDADIKRGRKYCSKKCFGIANTKIDKTPIKCECCKKEFVPEKVSLKRSKLLKFCSRECYQIYRNNNPIDLSNKKNIKTICKACGKEILVTEYNMNYGRGQYCSDECRISDNKREIVHNKCKQCGIEFIHFIYGKEKYREFCSKECATKSISKESILTTCKQCGKDVIIKGKEHHRLQSVHGNFCNSECMHKYLSEKLSGENATAWRGGISYLPYCYKFNDRRKKSTRDFFNNTCIICGRHQSEELTQLDVHHVYYNKTDGCDGRPFNLVSLCHTCHSRTNHNREYWESYIKKLLEDLFNYGIFSRKYYELEVMYPEE
jgi:hypothetical protein